MNPPAGTPLWAVILIAIIPSLATIVVAVIQSRQIRGLRDQQTATKWEITNDHSAPLRADMDEKHERVMTALANLRDDMNGEFKTVNERVANAEREHLHLREDIRELRRHR
jgi:gas vesicle protein